MADPPVISAASVTPESADGDELTLMDVIEEAERFVKDKFREHDPSHDWHHVHRVRLMALNLTRCASLPAKPDVHVVELAALFHDLCDAKYVQTTDKQAGKGSPMKAADVLDPFFAPIRGKGVVSDDQIALIYRIVDNVSWSKEEARRSRMQQASTTTTVDEGQCSFEQSSSEFQCVSDADRLDAIGSIGILRVAAFSAVRNRPLHIPPANAANDPVPPAEQASGYNGSAVAHFYEKLLRIRGDRLKTEMARTEAERRQSVMSSFLSELDLEWLIADQGAQLSLLQS